METHVYEVKRGKADEILADEKVKREGEAQEFRPDVLGVEGEDVIIIVKGEEELFGLPVFKGLEEREDAEEILAKADELSDTAASAVGALFG